MCVAAWRASLRSSAAVDRRLASPEKGASVKDNRSVPPPTVVPILVYPDVRAAVSFLTAAFGFVERTRIGDSHRAQLAVGDDGAVIIADVGGDRRAPEAEGVTHVVRVRVAVSITRSPELETMAPSCSRRPSTESTGSGTAPCWISPATAGN